jgi:hypothetical protein
MHDPCAPPYVSSISDYAERPKGQRNPAIKELVEDGLENAANPNISDQDFVPYVLHLSRSIEVRVEPYTNAPVKGILSIPLEDLEGVGDALALAITKVVRAAYRDAALKTLVDRQPG